MLKVQNQNSVTRRAFFLDRDGTINVKAETGCYIRQPEQMALLPGAAKAVRAINDSDALAVVITNQRWLSSIGVDAEEIEPVHRQLDLLLEEAEGAYLDATYVCPHAVGSCICRKPNPGLLLRAADDLQIDLLESVMIGDSISDVAAGHAAGTRSVLLSADRNSASPTPDRIFPSVLEAVNWAL